MRSTAIKNSFQVLIAETLPDGDKYVEIECRDYDHLRQLPKALSFDGAIYTRTGWDSDRCRAFYKSDKKFAIGLS